MPKFYITLEVDTSQGLVKGNDVMEVLTEKPEIADFHEAKIKYSGLIAKRLLFADPEKVVITMCVPCF